MTTHADRGLSAADLIPQRARALNAPFAELYKWATVGVMIVGKIVADVTRQDERGRPWRVLTLSPVVIVPEKAGERVESFAELAITATASIVTALPVAVGEHLTDYRGRCYAFHYSEDEPLERGQTLKRILVYDWTKKGFADLLAKLGPEVEAALSPLLDEQADLPF